ncbi:MAG: hypothetical protein ACE5K0_10180 [Candidatus Methanofastidiosia archaeon]
MKRFAFIVLSIMVFVGCVGQGEKLQESKPEPEPPQVNPIVEYIEKNPFEHSEDVARILEKLGEDGLQDNEKQLIDYISQLPAGLRANVATKVMGNQTPDNHELEIVKNSLVNPDITDELFGMSFMEMWDEGDLTKINFLNSVYSQNPDLAKEMMKNGVLDYNYEKTLLEVFQKNEDFAEKVFKYRLCIENPFLSQAEKNYLLNPTKANEEKVIQEYLNRLSDPLAKMVFW